MNEPQIPDIEGTAKKLTDTFDKMKPVLEAIEKMDAMGIPVEFDEVYYLECISKVRR